MKEDTSRNPRVDVLSPWHNFLQTTRTRYVVFAASLLISLELHQVWICLRVFQRWYWWCFSKRVLEWL